MEKAPPLPSDSRARLLDVRSVAAKLNCSVRHVYRLTETGQLPPPVRLGSLVRWPHAAIEEWIADGCPSICKESTL